MASLGIVLLGTLFFCQSIHDTNATTRVHNMVRTGASHELVDRRTRLQIFYTQSFCAPAVRPRTARSSSPSSSAVRASRSCALLVANRASIEAVSNQAAVFAFSAGARNQSMSRRATMASVASRNLLFQPYQKSCAKCCRFAQSVCVCRFLMFGDCRPRQQEVSAETECMLQ